MRKIRVWLKKEEIDDRKLAGSTAVVIDVLLATTTLTAILEAGARRVFPAGSMEEAERMCREPAGKQLVTGGEEDGLLIDGFDCGPFPAEFTRERVEGKDVLFLSTNGTRALCRCRPAGGLLAGCLRNAPAVAAELEGAQTESVNLVCAGSRGRLAWEDVLCAGAILARMDPGGWELDDAAHLVRMTGLANLGREGERLAEGRLGRWFADHDGETVLRFAGETGASTLVPRWQEDCLVPAVSGDSLFTRR